MAYKVYSDSYLNVFTKDALIRQLRCAEQNWQAAEERIEQQYQNTRDWQPVRHGEWITENITPTSQMLNIYAHSHAVDGEKCFYYTSTNPVGYKYCPNCGAKMNGKQQGTGEKAWQK